MVRSCFYDLILGFSFFIAKNVSHDLREHMETYLVYLLVHSPERDASWIKWSVSAADSKLPAHM